MRIELHDALRAAASSDAEVVLRGDAFELAVTMERIDGATALAWGLVDLEEEPMPLPSRSRSV